MMKLINEMIHGNTYPFTQTDHWPHTKTKRTATADAAKTKPKYKVAQLKIALHV